MKIFLSLLLLFIVIAAAMVYQATKSTASSVLIPSVLLNEHKDHLRVRIGGQVTTDAITYTLEPKIILKFTVRDAGSNSSPSVPVVYQGLKPDMFAPGRNVLIDGNFEGGILTATNLLTQCPSKYEPPSPSAGK
jgi:cytochrome c-type biogenesis protein CcmE